MSRLTIIFDAPVLLYFRAGSSHISKQFYELVSGHRVYVCASSIGEISEMVKAGKISIMERVENWMDRLLEGVEILPLDKKIFFDAHNLPDDSKLGIWSKYVVATARCERMTVVSLNENILAYPQVKSLNPSSKEDIETKLQPIFTKVRTT